MIFCVEMNHSGEHERELMTEFYSIFDFVIPVVFSCVPVC